MTQQSQISFTAPTLNTDGSTIAEPLSFVAYIDTANPPVKAYPVPAAQVAAAVNGIITATFAQLGFVPAANSDYFVDVTATDASGSSAPSAILAFSYEVVPAAPTGLKVS